MSQSAYLLFGIGMVVLLVAHVLRAVRHSLLFPRRDVPRRFDLLVGLSVAYFINVLIPFRIGELARILYITVRMKVRLSQVAATVVAERLSDLVVVAAIVAAPALVAGNLHSPLLPIAGSLLGVAAGLTLLALAVQRSARIRHWLWKLASIFNEHIALAIGDFLWSFAGLVRRGGLLRPRYLVFTLVMWCTYLVAYAMFATAMQLPVADITFSLLGAPLRSLAEEPSTFTIALLVFTSVPVFAILIYGLVRDSEEIVRSIAFARRFGLRVGGLQTPTLADAFLDSRDYSSVLKAQFSGGESTMADFGLHGVGQAVIQRILPGGSDALTAVVEVENRFSIRKFAIGDAAQKLEVQANWLREHAHALPLAEILSDRMAGEKYSYDMPLIGAARDFYEIIHTAPLERSVDVLGQVVGSVAAFHDRHRQGAADEALIDAYLDKKVIANVREILKYASLQVRDEYSVNHERFRLADWNLLLDKAWLRKQIVRTQTTVIHGDLTIENIIVCPDHGPGWYIIDPNPENIFQTELIDWAKMMQSLNLGYEGLNRGGTSQVRGDAIDIIFTRSRAYAELHTAFRQMLAARFTAEEMREIDFHELVNYLRLLPYKIRRAPEKAPTFFGSASILLRRYVDHHDS